VVKVAEKKGARERVALTFDRRLIRRLREERLETGLPVNLIAEQILAAWYGLDLRDGSESPQSL